MKRVNEPQQVSAYRSILVSMMSYKDGTTYENGYEFSDEQLGEIMPEDVYKWMANKVYGRPDPGHDDNPTLGCSSSLEYYMKALSYFIPYRLASWNPMTNSGNPTRSQPIIDLIKAVKKKEVRKQGKATSAVRPLEAEEFASTLNLLRKYHDILRRFQMLTLKLHMKSYILFSRTSTTIIQLSGD